MSTIADTMSDAAAEAMKLTRKYFVVELDFSEASVKQLASLFGDIDFTMPGGRSDANIDLLTRSWGSYFGEVLRRNLGGKWNETSTDDLSATIDVNGQAIQPRNAVKLQLMATHKIGISELYKQLRDAKQ